MATINARSFSTPRNINLKGQGVGRGGILLFEGTNATSPIASTDNGLYVNASNELVYVSQSTSTILGAAGDGSTQPSFESLYNNDQTMTITGTTFTIDRNTGNGDVLTLTNTGAGSGDVIQITNVGTGNDIEGTSDTWHFTKAGDMTANTAVFAGDAGSNSLTLTAGDVVVSDGSFTLTDADDAASLTITNDTATTASVVVIAGSGTFTGSTTTSFMTITPSGLTTGTGVYMPLAAMTTGIGLHVVANAVTTGQAVLIASSVAGTTLTTTGRLFKVDHTGAASGTGTVAEFASAAADETDILKVTASAGLTGGALVVSASSLVTGTAIEAADLDSLTTGIGLSIAGTGTGVTTGSMIRVSTGTTGAVATNGIVSIRGTGAHTSTSNTGLLDVRSSGMVGTLANATLVNFMATAAAQVDSTVLNVEASGFTTGFTGTMVRIKSPTTTGAGTVVGVIADGITSGGTAMDISTDALTTGIALNIANSGGAMTTGSLLRVAAQGTGAIATNGIVSFTHTGDFTSTSAVNGGFVEVKANDTTAGTVFNLVADALTTGIGMQLSNGTSGMTSGSLLRVTASGTGAIATNGIVSVAHAGAFTSTSNAGVLDVRGSAVTGTATLVNFMTTAAAQTDTTVLNVENSGFTTGYTGSMLRIKSPTTTGACKVVELIADGMTSGGTAMDITVDALTTGTGLSITNTGGVMTTTGELLLVSSTAATTCTGLIRVSGAGLTDGFAMELTGGGANATATGGVVNILAGAATDGQALKVSTTGVYTGTVGVVNIDAASATTGNIVSIDGTGLTEGTALLLNATEATLTSGFYIECNDGAASDFTVAKYGATTIAGNASGTAALTITAGDLLMSAGILRMATSATITADVGSVQGGSALTRGVNEIAVCANAGDAVTLPTAVAGQVVYIVNHGAQSADVFPASGDAINEAAANTAKALAADAAMICFSYDGTNWECNTLAR